MLQATGGNVSTARKTASRNAATGGMYSSPLGGLTAASAGKNKVTGNPVGAGVLRVYANDPAVRAGSNPTNAIAATPRAAVSRLATSSGGSSGGSSSGGGSSASTLAAVAAPVVAIPSLSDYINKSYLLNSVASENTRKLADYDAQSKADEQDTQADQAKRTALLQQDLDQQGNDNAESFAARGLGNSGLVFQAQDKINAAGDTQRDGIAQLLTDLQRTRQTGRLSQIAANNQARIDAISKLTDAYNTAVAGGNTSSLVSQ